MEQDNKLALFHDNPQFSDIIFEVEEQEIHEMSNMLKGFYPKIGELIETATTNEEGKKQVKITDFSYLVFKSFLAFVLGVQIEIADIDTGLELIMVANKFEVIKLVEYVQEYIKSQMTRENAFYLFRESFKRELPWIKEKIGEIIFLPNAKEIVKSSEFEELSLEDIDRFLSIPKMDESVEVGVVFEACEKWQKKNMGEEWTGDPPLKQLLPHFTLQNMELKQIIKQVYPTNIMESEKLLILIIGKLQTEGADDMLRLETSLVSLKEENKVLREEAKVFREEMGVFKEEVFAHMRQVNDHIGIANKGITETKETQGQLKTKAENIDAKLGSIEEYNKERERKKEEKRVRVEKEALERERKRNEEEERIRGEEEAEEERRRGEEEEEKERIREEREKEREIEANKTYLIVGEGNKLMIYDENLSAIKVVAETEGKNRYILVLSKNIVASTHHNKIYLWTLPTFSKHKILAGHTNYVGILFPLHNNLFGSASHDRTVKIWNYIDNICLRSITTGADPFMMGYIGWRLFLNNDSAGNSIEEWDLETGQMVKNISQEGAYANVIALANGNIATATEGKGFKIFSPEENHAIIRENTQTQIYHGGWNSRHLCEIVGENICVSWRPKNIVLWNWETDETFLIPHADYGPQLRRSMEWGINGLLCCFTSSKLVLFDLKEKTVAKVLPLVGESFGAYAKIDRDILNI